MSIIVQKINIINSHSKKYWVKMSFYRDIVRENVLCNIGLTETIYSTPFIDEPKVKELNVLQQSDRDQVSRFVIGEQRDKVSGQIIDRHFLN